MSEPVEKRRPYRFAFVLDQQVGWRTQGQNIERMAQRDPQITPEIVPVHWAASLPVLLEKSPLPRSVKGSLRGVHEVRTALAGKTFQAILWATWAAKSLHEWVCAAPGVLLMDMTPQQMEAMGGQYGYSSARANFLKGWKYRATAQLYQRLAHFVPISHWAADSLVADWSVPADKITVISPGTDTQRFTPAPKTDEHVRILFVGGDFVRKGGDLLLSWFTERRQRYPFLELHVVTRDPVPGEESLPGLFVYRGVGNNSEQLVALYRQADIFALPTRADCYSLVAMEAAAAGLPVVISRLGGIPDIVVEGETGYLIPPGDGVALGERLDTLLQDTQRRRAMGMAARARAVERFDAEANVQQMLDLMKGLVR